MDKIKIIVTTCDKFDRYLNGFVYMFNKNWPSDIDFNAIILGYSKPSFDLPDNFKFVSLGKQEKYGNDWTSALIPYFKRLADEYFILILDDFFILEVNKSLLYKAKKYMADGIEKISLCHFNGRSEVYKKNVDFNIYKQTATYRLTLHQSFIRKDYFLKYLKPGQTIWQYESNHKISINDGARILIPKKHIIDCVNFIQKGHISSNEHISKIKKEDLKNLKRLGIF